MGLCTAFVFSALVEFTVVNFWFRKFKKQKEHAMALMLPMLRTASNMTNVTNISGLTKNTMKVWVFFYLFNFVESSFSNLFYLSDLKK